jgi:cephalosporin hydroxylase
MRIVPGQNKWGIVMANSTVEVNGKTLTFDDIIYGYDLMFEDLALFSHTSWFGVATQQDPSDAFQLSSLMWREQPDLLIEIGTNTGGGAIFYASVMREYNPNSLVLTIDPKDPGEDWASAVGQGCGGRCRDVRCTPIWHSKNVQFIHGFSSAPEVLSQVEVIVRRFKKVMVMHDGSHFYQHVLEDLKNYDRFTQVGSYMVVQDTKMTRMYTPLNGNPYPLGAVNDFLAGPGKGRYVVDKQYEYLIYSQHHNGWLRKVA